MKKSKTTESQTKEFKEKLSGSNLPMTFTNLVIGIFLVIAICSIFYFLKEGEVEKIAVYIVCPILILYMIYSYIKEKRADTKSIGKKRSIADGTYYDNSDWQNKYTEYSCEHHFEHPKYSDLKKDLLSRYKNRQNLMLMMVFILLFAGSFLGIQTYLWKSLLGIIIFAIFGIWTGRDYFGYPVRNWLKGINNYEELNNAYKNADMLTFKKNGIAFGSGYLFAYTDKNVYCFSYKNIVSISKKVIREKKYDRGLYNSEEYKHIALIHVHLPEGNFTQNIEIELNEFQVQMVIDNLRKYK